VLNFGSLWERLEGGIGKNPRYRKWSCFEKRRVNVSAVHGVELPGMQKYFAEEKPIFLLHCMVLKFTIKAVVTAGCTNGAS
jgi:coproporphyrinogen III oxidase